MKKIITAILAGLSLSCLGLAASCGATTTVENKLAFNEGYLEEIVLGDPIMLDEYIDPNLTDDYTAILKSKETGAEFDLKMLGQWTTEFPGEFTFTYTVNSGDYKGTISTDLTVTVPEIEWAFTRNTLIYRAGETLDFNLLFSMLNISVLSYYDYDFVVKSVTYNDEEKTDLMGESSYEFAADGTYSFLFAVQTEDGQELSAEQKVTVRPGQEMGEGAEEWLEENNASVHDYTYISGDGHVALDAGYYNLSLTDNNVPYIAFNGEEGSDGYGADTYLMVDFTGRNLPQVAFFCDTVTSSITDGGRGIYIHNGLTYSSGTFLSTLDASRLTVFGPNKVGYGEFDNRGRYASSAVGTAADPCPMSFLGLSETDQYRYIVGFTEASTSSVTLRILLINMTTMERVFDHSYKCKTVDGYGDVDYTDYFSGSIMLYGRFGYPTILDKVYAPITNVDDIYDLDVASEFKDSYKKQYALDSVARVADYIDIPQTAYDFYVVDPDGEQVEISAEGTFRYTKSGTYRIFYDCLQEGIRASSISVDVMFDPNQDMGDDFFEKEGAIYASAVRAGTGLVTNTNKDYIIEGEQSIKYYTNTTTTGGWGLAVGVARSFLDFVFLSREVEGLSFEVYSERELNHKFYPAWGDAGRAEKITMDYTGTIPAQTWTTLTLTRDMYLNNSGAYDGWQCALALSLYVDGEELPANYCVYIDNVQLVATDCTTTITDGASQFLADNNMTLYACESMNDDLQLAMYKGLYSGEAHALKTDDLPYLAYNGNYGAGSYFVADFTGKNVPQLCFFAKDITSSLIDGGEGVYIHHGLIKNDGQPYSPHDCGRVTFFGLNKVEYCHFDDKGRFDGSYGYQTNDPVNSPLSVNGLEDGVHYRYAVGIKSIQTGRVVLELLLLNLDTNQEVVRYERVLENAGLTAEYCTGNVIMYGRYNAAITLDKVYAAYEGVSSVYDIDVVQSVLGA